MPEFKVDPLTSDRWSDFEALFGPRGACGGCWCMTHPVEPKKSLMPLVFAFNGLASSFLRAGFNEVARRSETRPLMRYYNQRPNMRLQRIARSRRP